ncbi:hypothetical protein H6A23_05320 [Olsenella uli]|uniref:Spy0128 family protein n=1 Tax=Olsenella uli TaxID=133926 RepID=UPI001956658D|nr:SpaA isopeptide-forming pilin-related protein [Olsenella uli]MBM6816582.1 hypothetical protein [Olsenella uli]
MKVRRRTALGRAVSLLAFAAATMLLGLGVAPATAWADAAQEDGIVVNLHDYDRSGWGTINDSLHAMKFGDMNDNTFNEYTHGNQMFAEIVQRKLSDDGCPVLNYSTTRSTQSLSYLFGGDGSNRSYIHNYQNVTGLLQRDDDGYYYFDSSQNYARYNERTNSFTLTTDTRTGAASVPQFTPFDDSRTQSGFNYSFGLDISATFYMPEYEGESGVLSNGEDMIFDFTGDDDVWVFIDDVLVLDLGGIHDATSGNINFHTGTITYDASPYRGERGQRWTGATGNTYASIEDAFTAAGKTWNDDPYATHTIKFFYLERGDGGSNCRIRFNLPTIPDGSVEIDKDVTYSNLNDVSDIDFTFNAYVDYDGDGTDYQLYTGAYDVYEDGERVQAGLTAENGVIKLKDGQTARLITSDNPDGSRITRQSRYYVVETGATSDKYEVEINGTSASWQGGSVNGVKSPEFVVNQTAHVTFENSISAENSFNVEVKKDGKVEDGDVFYAMVMIGSRQYEGTYYLYDSDDDTSGEQRTTSGGLVELMAGQHAEIRGIVGGNTVTVYEVNADGMAFSDEDYLAPTFSMTDESGTPLKGGASNVQDDDGRTGIKGETNEGTALGQDPVIKVVMTNTSALAHYELDVFKKIDGREWRESDSFTFRIEGVGRVANPGEGLDTTYEMPLPRCDEGNVQQEVTIDGQSPQINVDGSTAKVEAFCPITFDEPGLYYYKVTEVEDGSPDDLVYDNPWYVELEVSDNIAGGGLNVTGMWVKRDLDSKESARGIYQSLVFTNRYVSLTFAGLQETKQVVGHDASAGDFSFTVTALADEATGTTAEQAAELAGLSNLAGELNGAFQDNVLTFSNGESITTDQTRTVRSANELTLTAANVGHTYVYEYAEVLGEDSKWHQEEETTWRVSVAVTWVDESAKDDIQAVLTLEKKVGDGDWANAGSATYKTSDESHADPLTVSFKNVYSVYHLDIFKGELGKDGSGRPVADPNRPLSDAEFTLYSDEACTQEVAKGVTSDGENGVTKGHVILSGLEEGGTYYLKETRVPSGYQILDKTIVIEVGRDQAVFTIPGDEGEDPTTETVQLNKDTATFSFSVANKPNPEFPTSGSSGTILMMSAGVAAVAVGGAYLARRKGLLRG